MEDRRWTPAQQEAIFCEEPDILVSAAAGSGKTAVLTKRIIEKLTDPDHPADISRMLIVTFTKAAAGELKERIAVALDQAIAENPSDKRLRRQYVLLSKAKINTIHGFCLDLVKQNFEALGLSPSASVADASQTSLLMEQVADAVLDCYYEGLPGYDDIDDFISFADQFIVLKDDRLAAILISLYNKVSSYPEGVAILLRSVAEFRRGEEGGLFATTWGDLVLEKMKSVFSYYEIMMNYACDFLGDGIYLEKYHPSFYYEREYCTLMLDLLSRRNLEGIRNLLFNHQAVPLKSLKKELQTDEVLFYRDERKGLGECISQFAEDFFSQSKESVISTAKQSADILEKLYRFLSAFERRYQYEKRIRGILDFNDLERLAHRLLVNEDGSPSDTAASVSAQFDEIYIDEYQDVNKLQDDIFAAIGARSKRFMVGDIKQSIYGFRGAEPSLFADYRRNDAVHKVYLRHNFRCDGNIIDFVNCICGDLFINAGKTVPYDKTDELVCGKGESGDFDVEVNIIDGAGMQAAERRAEEAGYVAARIRDMIASGTEPRDVAILLRSASRSASLFEDALAKEGVPSRNRVSKDLFVNPEVLLVISLLHVIDNPTRDIHLAAVLKSPLYNISISELARIRKHSPEGTLFDALKSYVADNAFSKGQYFLDKLAEYRSRSSLPVDELVWYIYNDAKVFAFAVGSQDDPSISSRRANLLLLYDYARRFESGSFRGLYNFIRYITEVMESDATMESAASTAENENVVRIMTIHQSKGLEFPVVFLCDCSSSFNDSDAKDRVLIDRDYGVTLKLSDASGLASLETVFRRAEGIGITAKAREEEIRVLYVAMTRAIHRLIITGSVTKPDSLITRSFMLSDIIQPDTGYLFHDCDNFLAWILITSTNCYKPVVITRNHDMDVEMEDVSKAPLKRKIKLDEERISRLKDEYNRRFAFQYPKGPAASLPAKLSVSELYPSILDEMNDATKPFDTSEKKRKTPTFYRSETVSAADRGIATHQFMQFCDFAELQNRGLDSEVHRLVERGFLDNETALRIDRSMLETFMRGELFSALCSAHDLMREVRFNVRLPAASFTEDPSLKASLSQETVLVQGIIDCLYTDSNGRLTLLDYKTDRIPQDMKASPYAFERFLIERHSRQLSYYRAACRYLFCRPVDRVLLYSFSLGRAIEVASDLLDEI